MVCARCKRRLKVPASIRQGMGPKCYRDFVAAKARGDREGLQVVMKLEGRAR